MGGKKLIYGVGINDADYVVVVREELEKIGGKRQSRVVWTCPFYTRWKHVLERCYSRLLHNKYPTYSECSVIEEWKAFSNFKAWMEKQDWQGKQLDKDLLYPGNKEYGPNTCVFVSNVVNSFVVESEASRGEYPIGVHWHKGSNKFIAQCSNPFNRKQEYLGLFTCPNEAHKTWLKRKQELAILLAAEQTDKRVAKAIIDRYMTYGGTND